MPEVRIEAKLETIAVLDGYCSATGKCRTSFINQLLDDWAKAKVHEATLVCRVAGVNPALSGGAEMTFPSDPRSIKAYRDSALPVGGVPNFQCKKCKRVIYQFAGRKRVFQGWHCAGCKA